MKQYPHHLLIRLSVEASADYRSVRRRLGGLPVRGPASERIDEVLMRHGLLGAKKAKTSAQTKAVAASGIPAKQYVFAQKFRQLEEATEEVLGLLDSQPQDDVCAEASRRLRKALR